MRPHRIPPDLPLTDRLRLHRLRAGNFPEKRLRLRAQPKLELETICVNYGRPDADVYGP